MDGLLNHLLPRSVLSRAWGTHNTKRLEGRLTSMTARPTAGASTLARMAAGLQRNLAGGLAAHVGKS